MLKLNHPIPVILEMVHKLLLAEQLIGLKVLKGKRNFMTVDEHSTRNTEQFLGHPTTL